MRLLDFNDPEIAQLGADDHLHGNPRTGWKSRSDKSINLTYSDVRYGIQMNAVDPGRFQPEITVRGGQGIGADYELGAGRRRGMEGRTAERVFRGLQSIRAAGERGVAELRAVASSGRCLFERGGVL